MARPETQRITMPQMAILNIAMKDLAAFLVTQPYEELQRWVREGVNMIELIPPEFEVDRQVLHLTGRIGGWVERRLLIPALHGMTGVHWDELLHLMDDAAAANIAATDDPDVVESSRYLQDIVGLFLAPGEDHGNPWYYLQMTRLRDAIIAKLEATGG